VLVADLASQTEVRRLVDELLERLARIDVGEFTDGTYV
jgi:hypothetical protein